MTARRAEDPDLPDSTTLRAAAPANPGLEAIFKALAASREVRSELVEDLRSQMDAGSYLSDEKLNLAIYRMLKDVLK